MVISKLNIPKVRENLSLIGSFLEKLGRLAKLSKREFLADERNPAAAESFLRRSIEAMFDVSRHILSKSYEFKSLEYKDVAQALGEKKIVSPGYAETLVKMAGYRNRMVHYYKEIKPEELYDILQKDLGDIEKFLLEIEKFLKNYLRQAPD
ncbi:MAG: DUF86 domain-containing protein [Acidobacteriota bacterium]